MKNSPPQYASFWTRLTAYVLDALILGIPFALFVMPIIGSFVIDTELVREQMNSGNLGEYYSLYTSMITVAISCIVVWAALLALVTSSKWQATPGKRIMGVYVSDADGGKANFLQCFFRFAALPLLMMTIQTPERFYIYDNLQELAQNPAATEDDLHQSFTTPISGFIGLVSLLVLCVWYGLVAMRPQKTAGHDILFNTRVIHGRP